MIIRIVPPDAAPLTLLALADPSPERVRRYVRSGLVFLGEQGEQPVAAAVLTMKGDEAELMNLAVTSARQREGLGARMLQHVLGFARAARIRRVHVGTGETSVGPMAFYEKAGFVVTGRVEGFFANDNPPIVEHGVICRDMIRLAIEL